ncbi:MAG: hypothetical protein Q4G26_12175 [Paracoccus sp. (in: a-proteobacteria)]|nr:hypothetical protein [Paracoccus sp. (in: a-proteobacteria)]
MSPARHYVPQWGVIPCYIGVVTAGLGPVVSLAVGIVAMLPRALMRRPGS